MITGFADSSFAGTPDSLPTQPATFARGLQGVPVYVVSGLSKIAALPQMKAAWIVVTAAVTSPNPDQAPNEALARLEIIADTFLSMNAPIQWALSAWLAGRSAIQQQIRHRVTANLASLDRHLDPNLDQAIGTASAVQRLAIEGGWYSILRIPALSPDDHTVLALLDRGVWVHPGYFFGLPESGWLVLSLLAPESEFSNGVAIMIDYLRTNHERNSTGR